MKNIFNEWLPLIDTKELKHIINILEEEYRTKLICPDKKNVFKAFKLCSYNNLKIVFLGMDPYPQKGIATGLLFGNNKEVTEDKLSPSLRILKNSIINFEVPHNHIIFDNSLESWAKQGILLLNSSLTVEVNRTGSHSMLWRPFISSFIRNLSNRESGIIYVLFGEQAQTFEPYINKSNYIIKVKHPAWYSRTNTKMSNTLFRDINDMCYKQNGIKIKWYEELDE